MQMRRLRLGVTTRYFIRRSSIFPAAIYCVGDALLQLHCATLIAPLSILTTRTHAQSELAKFNLSLSSPLANDGFSLEQNINLSSKGSEEILIILFLLTFLVHFDM